MAIRFPPFRPRTLIRAVPHSTIVNSLFNGTVGDSMSLLLTGVQDSLRPAVTIRNRDATGRHLQVQHSSSGTMLFEVTDAGAVGSITPVDGSVTNEKIAPDAVTTDKIADGTIVNGDISPTASVAVSKLNAGGTPTTVLRTADGVTPVWGKLVTQDMTINTIDGDRLLDNSVPSSKLSGGLTIPNNSVQSIHIQDGTILNVDVNAAAGIAYSKLALANGIVDADVNTAAAIAVTKVAHVGAGNVLRSTGTQNVGGKVLPSDTLAYGLESPIINGGFELWQRWTSRPAIASGEFTADRFKYQKGGTISVVHTAQQAAPPVSTSTVPKANAALELDVTTADTSLVSGEYVAISHVIEGYNFLPLWEQQFTIGFWVRDTKTGIHCIAFRNSGLDRCYVAEYTVLASDTWEYKTVTVPASSGGSWNTTNGIGLDIWWTIACHATTLQGTANTWNTTNCIQTGNQVNGADSASNFFRLWGVVIGLGATVAPYFPRPYPRELALCKRYYQRLGGAAAADVGMYGYTSAGNAMAQTLVYPEETAVAPIATKVGTWFVTNCGQPSVPGVSRRSLLLSSTVTATGNALVQTVDATTYIDLNAEL